jgi:hypothetical protein
LFGALAARMLTSEVEGQIRSDFYWAGSRAKQQNHSVSGSPISGCSQLTGWPFQCQCGDQCRIRTEEEITERQTPPVGDPSLHQMVRPIVQHVAALTEGSQIFQPVVGGVAVQVRRCENDARHPELSCLHEVGPTGKTPTAIPPGRRLVVEPAPVRQAAEDGEMGAAAALAPSSGALEADVAAQFAPVWRIEWSQRRAEWHGYATSFFPSTR